MLNVLLFFVIVWLIFMMALINMGKPIDIKKKISQVNDVFGLRFKKNMTNIGEIP